MNYLRSLRRLIPGCSAHSGAQEPLVCGARLNVSCNSTPGLMGALCQGKTVFSEQLVDTAGPELADLQAMGSLLGVGSAWLVQRCLESWRKKLFAEKKNLLLQYTEGGVQPNPTDTCPYLHLRTGFKDFSSPFL